MQTAFPPGGHLEAKEKEEENKKRRREATPSAAKCADDIDGSWT